MDMTFAERAPPRPLFQIRDPDTMPRRRTRKAGMPESSTQRGVTQAEMEDIRLARERHLRQQQAELRGCGQVRRRRGGLQDHASYVRG